MFDLIRNAAAQVSISFIVLSGLVSLTHGAPLRLLPLGDSITQASATAGANGGRSYRYELWKLFVDHGVAVDFVGSLSNPYSTLQPYEGYYPDFQGVRFDPDHEGHSAWAAFEILPGQSRGIQYTGNGNLGEWVTDYTADLALIHLGHNDIYLGRSTDQIVASLAQIIETLQADNPNIDILLAQVIPSSHFLFPAARINALNAAIPELAANASTEESNVYVVDQHTGFSVAYLYDRIHPNAAGERRMAETWFASLEHLGLIHSLPCDLDLDADCDVHDLDALTLVGDLGAGVTEGDPAYYTRYDLNDDHRVDSLDIASWLREAALMDGFAEPYLMGDTDVNGVVDFADFVALNNNWQQATQADGTPVVWSGGDLNGDGIVDFADFASLNNNWQRSIVSPGSRGTVPEPVGMLLFLSIVAGVVLIRHASRTS